MKKIMMLFSTAIIFSCGGANDGDARTDTTSMPIDTNLTKNEVNHSNSSVGTTIADSTNRKDSVFSH